MMKQNFIIIANIFALLLFTSCSADNAANNTNSDPASSLPLLTAGNKIGMITGFNPDNPEQTMDSIESAWETAIESGLNAGRLQIDWTELEPQPRVFNKSALEKPLTEYDALGLETYLLISAYDSEGPVVPEDLKGKPMDDPELINRFKRLMDWVIPMMADYSGYLISIANEPDNNFLDEPKLEVQILNFLKESKAHIHKINKEMAVTVTLTEGGLDEKKPGIKQIIEESDVACFNFYGAKSANGEPWYLVQSETELKADISRLLDFTEDKIIVIQELGLWSGNDYLNSSEEKQRKFFEIFFSEMQSEPRLRAAYVFQLVDWSPTAADVISSTFDEGEVPESFIRALDESLETMGMLNYDDGLAKPAWYEFLKWLEKF